MLRWGVAAYFLLASSSVGVAAWLGQPILSTQEPWFILAGASSHLLSLLLGLTLAVAIVLFSRISLNRFLWARQLHSDLRPVAKGLTSGSILLLACASGLAEELLFRGLLLPYLGIWGQALLFGLVHQHPGASRWVWVSWAAVAGLLLGAVFQATGSLVGPISAHVLINWVNLTFLREYELPHQSSDLGGLLRR